LSLQLGIEFPLPNDLLVGNIEIFRDDVNDVGNFSDVLDLVPQIDGRGMLSPGLRVAGLSRGSHLKECGMYSVEIEGRTLVLSQEFVR
jgi:hypothetical protein